MKTKMNGIARISMKKKSESGERDAHQQCGMFQRENSALKSCRYNESHHQQWRKSAKAWHLQPKMFRHQKCISISAIRHHESIKKERLMAVPGSSGL